MLTLNTRAGLRVVFAFNRFIEQWASSFTGSNSETLVSPTYNILLYVIIHLRCTYNTFNFKIKFLILQFYINVVM